MMMGKKIKLLCRAMKLTHSPITDSDMDNQIGLINGILDEITRIVALEEMAKNKGIGGVLMMSTKIKRQALDLKCLIQRSMSTDHLEKATRLVNGILAEAERVEGLENEVLKPEPPSNMESGFVLDGHGIQGRAF